jgi:hypothetical protein
MTCEKARKSRFTFQRDILKKNVGKIIALKVYVATKVRYYILI